MGAGTEGEGPEAGAEREEHEDFGVGGDLDVDVKEGEGEQRRGQRRLPAAEEGAGGGPEEGDGEAGGEGGEEAGRPGGLAQGGEGGGVPEEEEGALVVPEVAIGDRAVQPAAGDGRVAALVRLHRGIEERRQEEQRQGGEREEGGDGEEAGLEAAGGERVNPGEPSLALLCGQFGPVSHLGHHGSVYDGAVPRARAGRRRRKESGRRSGRAGRGRSPEPPADGSRRSR